jgi:hypothetical protein
MSFYIAFFFTMFLVGSLNAFLTNHFEWVFLLLIIPFLVGILGLRLLIWLIQGKERIVLTDTELIIEKSGTYWLQTKTIQLKDIERITLYLNFHEQELGYDGFKGFVTRFRNQRPVFRIQNIGRLRIHYKRSGTYRILNGLSIGEGNYFREKLMQAITEKFPDATIQ